jgi:hypothetical protein
MQRLLSSGAAGTGAAGCCPAAPCNPGSSPTNVNAWPTRSCSSASGAGRQAPRTHPQRARRRARRHRRARGRLWLQLMLLRWPAAQRWRGLLGGVVATGAAAQAATLPEDKAEAIYHVYDGGGVKATGPALLVRKSLADKVSLSAQYYVDAVSNASIDVVTTASPFKETRKAWDFSAADRGARQHADPAFHAAREPDYRPTPSAWTAAGSLRRHDHGEPGLHARRRTRSAEGRAGLDRQGHALAVPRRPDAGAEPALAGEPERRGHGRQRLTWAAPTARRACSALPCPSATRARAAAARSSCAASPTPMRCGRAARCAPSTATTGTTGTSAPTPPKWVPASTGRRCCWTPRCASTPGQGAVLQRQRHQRNAVRVAQPPAQQLRSTSVSARPPTPGRACPRLRRQARRATNSSSFRFEDFTDLRTGQAYAQRPCAAGLPCRPPSDETTMSET